MIEIKCSDIEQARLMRALSMTDAPCLFTGQCSELPYYRTGMSCKECTENNIKWTIIKEEE